MGNRLRLLHTAQVHVARFDALRDAIAPELTLEHIVDEGLLARAQAGGITPEIIADIKAAMGTGPTLCTCTTIGEAAENAGATRIDRPMMQIAAQSGNNICLALVLESTAQACDDLLADCIATSGRDVSIDLLVMPDLWALFETGDIAGYEAAIAARIKQHISPETDTIIIAQGSMTDAARHLSDTGLKILTSPETAFRAALKTL